MNIIAAIETVLKLRDQFTNVLGSVTTAVKNVASSGAAVGESLSGGLTTAENIFAKTGAGLEGLNQKYQQVKSSFSENLVPEDLINLKDQYSGMVETMNALGMKYSSQLQLLNSWKEKVTQLSGEYNRLNSFKDFAGADNKLTELNKAKIQMANLRLAVDSSGTAIDKMKANLGQTEAAIKKAENSQKLFNRTAQAAINIAGGVKNAFQNISSTIDSAKAKIHNMIDSSKNKMSGGMDLGGFLKGFVGLAAVKKGFDATLGAGSTLINQLFTLQGMFGNADIGQSYFSRLKQYASDAGKNIDELMNTTQLFLSSTKNTDQLMAMTEVAEKLAMKNSTQGMEGAAYAINEALAGQYTSLKNRFNLSGAQLEPIKKAISTGNFEGITQAFNDVLAGAGITDELIKSMRNTVPNQLKSVVNDVKSGLASAGMGALDNLAPVISQVKEWLNSPGGMEFFNIIGNGLSMVTQGFAWLGNTVTQNWDIIQPVLIALGVLALATGATMAISWALSAAPMFAVVALIGVFIAQLKNLGVTTEDIVTFVGGIFGVLGSTVGNVFIGIWNIAVDVAEFLNNVFIDPAYAIQMLFYNLSITVLGFFNNMVQGIVSAVNWVIDKINQISGSSMKKVEVNFVSDWIDNLEAKKGALTSDKNVVDFSGLKKELISGANAFDVGTDYGAKLFNTVSDGLDNVMANENAWNASQNAALDGIKADTGKISNSVDIGNEQIKYLRDIAEREAVNKFTNNTIVPQMEITMNVKETADVDQIFEYMADMVDEAVDTSEEGDHV